MCFFYSLLLSFSKSRNFNRAVGTHHRTEGTACASVVVRTFDGVITVLVDFFALHLQDFLGAGVDTQLAAFAPLKI
jgi:hypothetical protein